MKLTKTLEDRVAAHLKRGVYSSTEELLTQALDSLDETEAIREAIAEGQADLDAGRFITMDESRRRMAELVDRYRQRE